MLLINLIRKLFIIVFSIVIASLYPYTVNSAEIFQISSASSIQVGDQNRVYNVDIGCVSVDPKDEDEAFKWLKSELPRHTKVNLRPIGYSDGKLISKVIKISSNQDLGMLMKEKGIAEINCLDY